MQFLLLQTKHHEEGKTVWGRSSRVIFRCCGARAGKQQLLFTIGLAEEDFSSPTPNPEPSQLPSLCCMKLMPEPTADMEPEPAAIDKPEPAERTGEDITPKFEPFKESGQVRDK